MRAEGRRESHPLRQLGNEAAGLTQGDLVRKSGVKHTTLTKIESNVVVKPSVQTVAKIAKALGVSIEELIK